METAANLYQRLWSASDELRGAMDANDYKNYLLGIIFYKYLSDNELQRIATGSLKSNGKNCNDRKRGSKRIYSI